MESTHPIWRTPTVRAAHRGRKFRNPHPSDDANGAEPHVGAGGRALRLLGFHDVEDRDRPSTLDGRHRSPPLRHRIRHSSAILRFGRHSTVAERRGSRRLGPPWRYGVRHFSTWEWRRTRATTPTADRTGGRHRSHRARYTEPGVRGCGPVAGQTGDDLVRHLRTAARAPVLAHQRAFVVPDVPLRGSREHPAEPHRRDTGPPATRLPVPGARSCRPSWPTPTASPRTCARG
jgi:hypothetical protein